MTTIHKLDERVKALELACFPWYDAKFNDSTPGVPNMKSSAEFIEYCTPRKWMLIEDQEFTTRDLAMMYFGYIAGDDVCSTGYDELRASFDDMCIILKFIESYLENMKVRKFVRFDKVFSTIDTYILMYFGLLGQTDVSVSQLAGLIRADMRKK